MTNEIQIFQNDRFGTIRALSVDGEPWFVAKDVCVALAIKNSRDALARLDDDEKGVALTDTPGGEQRVHMEWDEGALPEPEVRELSELWWPRNRHLPRVDGVQGVSRVGHVQRVRR